MNVEELICSQTFTIKEVMMCIDQNAKGTAFIVNDADQLVGIVTDGDIRRLLLEGYGLNQVIREYMHKNFVYASKGDEPADIRKKFSDSIKIIPVVDENMRLVDFSEYDENVHISLAQPQLNGNEYRYLMDAFLSTWISSTGKYVTQFEKDFADYCGVSYGVATSNGTSALHLALAALGIGPGDEVIVPDLTFAATINAVLYTGATPVIVDIEEDSWCMDPDQVQRAVTPNTKAVIPVHIYGQPCDMGRIVDIAQKHQLYMIEDCAEAHGAEWDHKKIGSFGVISCFSFFGNKVITTGEGGMCVTNNEDLNHKMRILRDHGMSQKRKYYHEVIGFNYRMTNMQAAVGVAQLERIDQILEWRMQLEEQYREIFAEAAGIQMQKNSLLNRKKIAWLVSVLVEEQKRDRVLQMLKDSQIDARAFFIPLSEMDIYRKYARECSVSKKIAGMGINLPTTCDMDEQKIKKIGSLIRSILSAN